MSVVYDFDSQVTKLFALSYADHMKEHAIANGSEDLSGVIYEVARYIAENMIHHRDIPRVTELFLLGRLEWHATIPECKLSFAKKIDTTRETE